MSHPFLFAVEFVGKTDVIRACLGAVWGDKRV